MIKSKNSIKIEPIKEQTEEEIIKSLNLSGSKSSYQIINKAQKEKIINKEISLFYTFKKHLINEDKFILKNHISAIYAIKGILREDNVQKVHFIDTKSTQTAFSRCFIELNVANNCSFNKSIIKNSNLTNCKISNSIIFNNTTLENCKLTNCYIINSTLLNSKLNNNYIVEEIRTHSSYKLNNSSFKNCTIKVILEDNGRSVNQILQNTNKFLNSIIIFKTNYIKTKKQLLSFPFSRNLIVFDEQNNELRPKTIINPSLLSLIEVI